MMPMSNYIFISFSLLCLTFFIAPSHGFYDTIQVNNNPSIDTLTIEDSLLSTDSLIIEDNTPTHSEKKFDPVATPYWAIGTNLGRMIYQWSFFAPQEYNLFINLPIKKQFHSEVEIGRGHHEIDFTHLKYQTSSWFFNIQFQYNIISSYHTQDKDRFYIAPYWALHHGSIQNAELLIEQPNFTLSESLENQQFLKSSFGIKVGVEVEVFPKLFLSWQGQAGLLIASNKFKEIKPMYIAGYGNSDQNIGFRFGFNISYYFLVKKIR